MAFFPFVAERTMYDHKQSVKEVIRHVLFRCGLVDTLDLLRHWRGQNTEHLRKQNLTNIFSQIYANDVWIAPENQESLSGVGSTQGATSEFVVRLSTFLREVGCRQLVDIAISTGCGTSRVISIISGSMSFRSHRCE
jgi:hypothetical protein